MDTIAQIIESIKSTPEGRHELLLEFCDLLKESQPVHPDVIDAVRALLLDVGEGKGRSEKKYVKELQELTMDHLPPACQHLNEFQLRSLAIDTMVMTKQQVTESDLPQVKQALREASSRFKPHGAMSGLQLCAEAYKSCTTCSRPFINAMQDIIAKAPDQKLFAHVTAALTSIQSQLKDEFYILITGETSSGKSAVINALLGMHVLPSQPGECTKHICEVAYGETFALVIGTERFDFKDNALDLLAKMEELTKASNGDEPQVINASAVIRLEVPSSLLREGNCVLVDSPGIVMSVHDTQRLHDDAVKKYAPDVAAIIMVQNAEGVPFPPSLKYVGDVCAVRDPNNKLESENMLLLVQTHLDGKNVEQVRDIVDKTKAQFVLWLRERFNKPQLVTPNYVGLNPKAVLLGEDHSLWSGNHNALSKMSHFITKAVYHRISQIHSPLLLIRHHMLGHIADVIERLNETAEKAAVEEKKLKDRSSAFVARKAFIKKKLQKILNECIRAFETKAQTYVTSPELNAFLRDATKASNPPWEQEQKAEWFTQHVVGYTVK